MKSPDLDRSLVETAYARWAPIYDAVCGPVMVKGRRAAAAAARARSAARFSKLVSAPVCHLTITI